MNVGFFDLAVATIGGLAAYLISQEIDGRGKSLSERMLLCAVQKLPVENQERYLEEWMAIIEDQPTPFSKVLVSLSLYLKAGSMRNELAEGANEFLRWDQFQRYIDVILSVCGIFVFSLLFVAISICIALSSSGPVLYSHRRVGRNGQSFGCLKFRTMVVNGDEVLAEHLARNEWAAAEWALTRKLSDDPRITKVGAFLRSTSLDELPQLVNILRGEMSIVGPRPIVSAELERYGPHADAYLATRPGLTGLWQVSGRSDVDYEERVRLDRQYVEERSFCQYVKIVFRTALVVLSRRGEK